MKRKNNGSADNIAKKVDQDQVVRTNGIRVIYCEHCSSPVVDHPEAIAAHNKRVHPNTGRKKTYIQ